MTADRRIPGEPRDDLLDETIEDLYENAPCGYLTTWPDGRMSVAMKKSPLVASSRSPRVAR
jgi:hypothetical protein